MHPQVLVFGLALIALCGCRAVSERGGAIVSPRQIDRADNGAGGKRLRSAYRLWPDFVSPAEFSPLEGLFIGWQPSLTRSDGMDRFFIELTAKALGGAKVYLLARNDSAAKTMVSRVRDALLLMGRPLAPLHDHDAFEVLPVRVDSIWVRDFGPLSLLDRQQRLHLVDHLFDPRRPNDEQFPLVLAALWGVGYQSHPLTVAGGNFQSNGAGDCFTALGQTGRLAYDREMRAHHFRLFLGCERVHILKPMIREATGHVDMFLSLVGPRDVIIGAFAPGTDEANRSLLDRNAAQISSLRDRHGAPRFRVHRLPMPYTTADSVMRSYTNLQLSRSVRLPQRGVVLVPRYTGLQATERVFLSGLRRVLHLSHPDVRWRIETVVADHIIESGGAVHCVTNTIPVGRRAYLKPRSIAPKKLPPMRLDRARDAKKR